MCFRSFTKLVVFAAMSLDWALGNLGKEGNYCSATLLTRLTVGRVRSRSEAARPRFGCGGLPKEVLKGRGTLPNAPLQITGRDADDRLCAKYIYI